MFEFELVQECNLILLIALLVLNDCTNANNLSNSQLPCGLYMDHAQVVLIGTQSLTQEARKAEGGPTRQLQLKLPSRSKP